MSSLTAESLTAEYRTAESFTAESRTAETGFSRNAENQKLSKNIPSLQKTIIMTKEHGVATVRLPANDHRSMLRESNNRYNK